MIDQKSKVLTTQPRNVFMCLLPWILILNLSKYYRKKKTYTGIVIAKRYRDYFGKQIENKEKFVYIKGVIRNRKSKKDRQYSDRKKNDRQYSDRKKKDRQYSDRKKKDRQYSDRKKNDKKINDDLHITQKIKDWTPRTPLKTGSEHRCSVSEGISCSTSGTNTNKVL